MKASFLVCLLAGTAAAELPRTINVQGLLTSTGGTPAADGTYALTWRLYAAEADPTPVWTGTDALVAVKDGLFSAALGDEPGVTPPAVGLFSSTLWLGITVDGEPELPRRPILPVPQALYAESATLSLTAMGLECSGCVGPNDLASGSVEPQHLSPAARALFLSSAGGTVSGAITVTGGVDLQGSLLSGARLASGDVAGKVCTAGDLGRVVVDAATSRLYWCNGATYLRLATCSGACKPPSAVPCGLPITDDCGDAAASCTGKGAGCPAGQLCGASGCFNDGSSALSPAATCKVLHAQAPGLPSATYWIDPDGAGGLSAFEAPCDMTTDGGGWTIIHYAADLPFQNHFTSGDGYKYLPTDFKTVLSSAQIAAIQAVSTEGQQTYVGQCDNVIHYFYNTDGNYAYAFGFKFLDGTQSVFGQQSYAPLDITVIQDGCKVNGGENGSLALATVFSIRSPKVPVINVQSRDSGDATEKFGSPLTAAPARLR